MTTPATKLLAHLRLTREDTSTWCDYWRGFWDATRAMRKDLPACAALGVARDKPEYLNGYRTGDKAYKAARFKAVTNPFPKKKDKP